jgi:tRNA-specific 2-thiouridylase
MKEKVLLGCSGGVDSSVSIYLLLLHGFEVFVLNFSTWKFMSSECDSCDVYKQVRLRALTDFFNINYYHEDLQDVFYNTIVCGFIDKYMDGKTPNPCVECNRHIKFKILFDKSSQLCCDYVATGHYACISCENGRFFVKKGVDVTKDQSYFLWGLGQQYLSKIIFPLGELCKKDVKDIARNSEFYKFIDKEESEDLCFLKKYNYRDLLCSEKKDIIDKLKDGDFIFEGQVVGKHHGYPFYTIGQRTGLGIALGFPVFVSEINKCKNEVILSRDDDVLWKDEMIVTDLNFQKYETIKDWFHCMCKIRYKDVGHECTVKNIGGNSIKVKFFEKVRAITPGQSAVFYEGDDVVCGGIIT